MKRSICPSCHKREGVALLWGYPDGEDLELNSRREVVLGGCIVDDIDLNRECRSCGHRWNSALLTEDKPPVQSLTHATAQKTTKSTLPTKTAIHDVSRFEIDGKMDAATRPQPISVSLLPTFAVFVLTLLVVFACAGAISCSDGWASGSVGRSGACSHHGGVNRLPGVLALVLSVFAAAKFHFYRINRAHRK